MRWRLALGLLLVAACVDAAEIRSRVALVAVSETLEVVAARRSLQAMGIPFATVQPTDLAIGYAFAILPGPLYNTTLTALQREAVYSFVSKGGVLLATQVEGSDYFPLFGITVAKPRRDRFRLRFVGGVEDGWLRYLDHPKEREISLGDAKLFKETIWSVGYTLKFGRALALYPDKTAAAVVHDYDAGQALALGVSLTHAVLLAQVGQHYEPGRQYVNSFEPSGDVFMLLLRGLFESAAHPAVYWHTVPRGLETAIVLTHDVDARESFANSLAFAKLAHRHGVRSTFFVTTKTVTDAADIGYYDDSRIPFIVELRKLGFEVGSHTVAHSSRFAKFEMGSMVVTARTYRPTQAPTVLGEVKVSKELLDRDLPGQQTVSFRAGELAYPPRLIEALEATGYRYDSTFSANDIITNFPFFAFEQKHLGARETRLVEIPVTLDDSQGYLTRGTVDRVVKSWTEIIEANRANAAMTCILIHPTEATYKLEVLRRLLERYSREPVWMGTISAYGDFWVRRASVGLAVTREAGKLTIRLDRPGAALGPDLALVVAGAEPSEAIQVLDKDGIPVPHRVATRDGRRIVALEPKSR